MIPNNGIKCEYSAFNDAILILSIIKTNKKSTASAPTYTTINVTGKNSRFSKNSNDETLQKVKTRNNTEYTGFFEITTNKPEIKERLAKIQKFRKKIFINNGQATIF